jgi:hypothetical protein
MPLQLVVAVVATLVAQVAQVVLRGVGLLQHLLALLELVETTELVTTLVMET